MRLPMAGITTVSVLAGLLGGQALFAQEAGRTREPTVRVPILVYHHVQDHAVDDVRTQRILAVPPTAFDAQMATLRDAGVQVVTLGRLLDAIDGRDTIPGPAVVLTFDDGWASQFANALPVLRRYGYSATFFIYTAPIGRDPGFMTWDEVRALRDAGMEIGGHTRTHQHLPQMRDTAELRDEIAGGREVLEGELRAPVTAFAYPFGEWTSREEQVVREAGFRSARTVDGGRINGPADRYALHAVQVSDDMDAFRRIVGAGRTATGRNAVAASGPKGTGPELPGWR